jgi:hypothetical protein
MCRCYDEAYQMAMAADCGDYVIGCKIDRSHRAR